MVGVRAAAREPQQRDRAAEPAGSACDRPLRGASLASQTVKLRLFSPEIPGTDLVPLPGAERPLLPALAYSTLTTVLKILPLPLPLLPSFRSLFLKVPPGALEEQ